MDFENVAYYLASFVIGSAAGLPKARLEFRDSDFWDLVSRGILSGFLCFGIVSCCGWWLGDDNLNRPGLLGLGALGVNPEEDPERASRLTEQRGLPERVIPDAVLQTIKAGKPWFTISFNNELERLTRTQSIQDMLQLVNSVTAIAALNPDIVMAVNWYKLLSDINSNLSEQNQILLSEEEFSEVIAQKAQAMQAQMQAQAGQAEAAAGKDMAQANKSNAEAQKARA
mgnify:CR=1 FL=1